MPDDPPPDGDDEIPDRPPAAEQSTTEDGSDGDGPERVPGVDVSETWAVRAVVVLAVLLLLYSVVVAQQILLWVAFVTPFVLLYLLWRLVRAHERIAAAQERRARE